jgi:D-3-phosphoglycerate dehydrogenase
MNTLIIENKYFSKKSIKLLSQIGVVYFKKNSKNNNKINILYVRFKFYVNKKIIDTFPNLKFIVSPTTGLDHVDLNYCKKKKIKIYYLGNIKNKIANIFATADLTFALILDLLRNINYSAKNFLKTNYYDRYDFITSDIRSRKIGIIGYGRIGRQINKYSKIFNIKTIVCDKYNRKKNYKKKLNYLIKNSDLISINASSLDEPKIIDAKQIRMMKKGSMIVNTSRHSLVNEQAIANAIKSRKLGGYATDVLSNERDFRKIQNLHLFKLSKKGYNVIITPHIGGCTFESINKAEDLITEYFVNDIN